MNVHDEPKERHDSKDDALYDRRGLGVEKPPHGQDHGETDRGNEDRKHLGHLLGSLGRGKLAHLVVDRGYVEIESELVDAQAHQGEPFGCA